MEFSSLNLFVREVVNGSLTLSALLLLLVFVRFCWRNRDSLLSNRTLQVAVAIVVLMTGHFIRAGGAWMEFVLIGLGVGPEAVSDRAWAWFIPAAVLIFSGKVLMLRAFAPEHWKRWLFWVGIPLCVVIPAVLAIVIELR